MALPNTGITISMVRDEIGATSNDLGTLCKHENVNMWSKWKPINCDTSLSEQILINKNYGITVPEYTTVNNLISALNGTLYGKVIIYDKPTGGINSPYRLGDFRNYEQYAEFPISTGIGEDMPVIKKGSAYYADRDYFTYHPIQIKHSTNHNIGITDIYQNVYNGIAFIYEGMIYWYTGQLAITSTENVPPIINWKLNPLIDWEGEITVVRFLSNVRKTQSDVYSWDPSHRFYPIPADINNKAKYNTTVTNEYDDNTLTFDTIFSWGAPVGSPEYKRHHIYYTAISAKYAGGTVNSASLVTYVNSTYSTIIATKNLTPNGPITVPKGVNYPGSSDPEYGVYNSNIFIGTYTNPYFRLTVNGEIIAQGAIPE